MLKRKIYDFLVNWKNKKDKKPLIIKGQRQVGKTFIVKYFAKENYKNVIYLDFRKYKELRSIFDGSFIINDIISQISVNVLNSRIIPYQTLLIFDEIQDCPNARSSLKYFYEDGRYDVICTGSLLGIKGYNQNTNFSIPVGYEETIYMKPLDFEEFLWANGIDNNIISLLRECLENKKEVLPAIHLKLTNLFKKYICVGGMPEVVNKFVEIGDMNLVLNLQRNILESYKDDFGRHLKKDNSIFIDQRELSIILSVFNSIPSQLAKENKKFQFSIINGHYKNEEYKKAIEWLSEAGIINCCYNLSTLELPLEGNKYNDIFKVYLQDSGLFISMLEQGTQKNILDGNLLVYKGAIYENIVADAFSKLGRKLYYYHKDSGLEIDFVTRYNNQVTLIEVKATNGKSKSLKTILEDKNNYHVESAIKIYQGNIQDINNILYIPHYLVFLLNKY